MLYETYRSKVMHTAYVVKRILRITLPILAALILAAIGVAVMLAYGGSITKDPEPCSIMYGESPEWGAEAFLCEVSYEYASDGGGWSKKMPRSTGSYRVRGVTENFYGKLRFSGETTLTVLPRTVTVRPYEATWVYGDAAPYSVDHLSADELVSGDRIVAAEFGFSGVNAGRVTVSVNADSITIEDPDGNDVTHCYIITCEDAAAEITRRTVTVRSDDAEKIYDGTALIADGWKIAEGSMVYDHILGISVTGERINAGMSENTFSASVTDSAGDDVSSNYNINCVFGMLTVKKRPVSLVTGDARKVYDGKPLTSGEWKHTDGTLVGDHKFNVKITGSQTNAGSSANTFTARVYSGTVDMTENYEITRINGTLTVEPVKITVRSDSAEKIYDGTPLVCARVSIEKGSLVAGHTLRAYAQTMRTDVGSSENRVRISVTADGGEDVTANYEVTLVCGTLTVRSRPITVRSESAEKVYDGKPFVWERGSVTEGSLAAGHRLAIHAVDPPTDAGKSRNRFTVTITDARGAYVTSNYTIKTADGTLTIKKRPITVESSSGQKVYDGTPLTSPECHIKENGGTLAEGQRLSAVATGSRTEVGTSNNPFTAAVIDGAGRDVSVNYDITRVTGSLTVTERRDESTIAPETTGKDTPETTGKDTPETTEPDTPGTTDGEDGTTGGDSSGDGPSGTDINTPDGEDLDKIVLRVYSTVDGKYLRMRSYGDYTGRGFAAPKVYSGGGSGDVAGSIAHASGGDPELIEVTWVSGAGNVAVPYWYYSSLYPSNDVQVIASAKEYQVMFVPGLAPGGVQGAENAEYRQFVYENYLALPEATERAMLDIAQKNGLSADSGTDEIAAYIQSAGVYDLEYRTPDDVNDIAVYFLTEGKRGICQHFAAAGVAMFRALGFPARYTVGYYAEYRADEWVEVAAKKGHAWVEVYIDGFGWLPVEVTRGFGSGGSGGESGGGSGGSGGESGGGSGGSSGGESGGGSGGGSGGESGGGSGGGSGSGSGSGEGTAHIRIITPSITKQYDGTPISAGDWYIVGGELAPGHRLKVNDGVEINTIGSIRNMRQFSIVDENGNNVTDQYDVDPSFGKLTITKRRIVISTGDAYKRYDGSALSCDKFWISEGSLVNGHSISVEMTCTQTKLGFCFNTYSNVVIRDEDGNDVTACYDIVAGLMGRLAVYP